MLTPPALSIELLDLADEFVAVARVLLDAFAPALGLGYMGSHRRPTQNRTKILNLRKIRQNPPRPGSLKKSISNPFFALPNHIP